MKKKRKINMKYEEELLKNNITKYNKLLPLEDIKNIDYYNIESNSWFDINKSNFNNKIKIKINNNQNNEKILICK